MVSAYGDETIRNLLIRQRSDFHLMCKPTNDRSIRLLAWKELIPPLLAHEFDAAAGPSATQGISPSAGNVTLVCVCLPPRKGKPFKRLRTGIKINA